MGPYKPIAGNKAGSYLTAFSLQGFYSNINGIIIGLVQIFADQSYWQSAVAASPIHAVKGDCYCFCRQTFSGGLSSAAATAAGDSLLRAGLFWLLVLPDRTAETWFHCAAAAAAAAAAVRVVTSCKAAAAATAAQDPDCSPT